MKNGYPRRIVSRILRTQTRQQTPTPDTTTEDQTPTPESEDNTTNRPPCLFLPYVQGLSEKIQSTCRKISVRTTFKSHGTLRQFLVDVKTKTLELKKRLFIGFPVRTVKQHTSEKRGGPYRNASLNISMQSGRMTGRMASQYTPGTTTTGQTGKQQK